MIQLYSPRSKPLPDLQGIWLAIKDLGTGRHTGIAYRVLPGEDSNFLHLGFHHELRCESISMWTGWANGYAWLACPGFSAEEALQLAVWLEKIWEANRNAIPYGLTYGGSGYFDQSTGKFVESSTGKGLTCATFVMAIFEDFLLPIVDWQTWPSRSTDAEFHHHIIDLLDDQAQLGRAMLGHVQAQKDALGIAPRFRPEEVVAAGGAYLGEPIGFTTSELLSRQILVDLADMSRDQA